MNFLGGLGSVYSAPLLDPSVNDLLLEPIAAQRMGLTPVLIRGLIQMIFRLSKCPPLSIVFSEIIAKGFLHSLAFEQSAIRFW